MPEPQDGQERSFANVIKSLGGGSFHDEATEALATLVKEITRVAEATGGKPKGKLILTIDLKYDRGIMDVDPSIKVTTPATVRVRTIMYAGPDGRLSKNDFRQQQLALESRDVSTTTPVRDIRSATTAS